MLDFIYRNFEWDIDNDLKNISKHGISFVKAIQVFEQENCYRDQ